MGNTKKIFLITLITIFSIWFISYSIELIDNKINGEMYSKIDNFIHSFMQISKSHEATNCAKQAGYYLVVDSSKNEMEKLIQTENDCQYTIKKMQEVKIPDKLPMKREKLVIDIKSDFIDLTQGYYQILKIRENDKIDSSKKEHSLNIYGHNILKQGHYLLLKMSDVKVRNNVTSRFKNLIVKIYMALTKKQFD